MEIKPELLGTNPEILRAQASPSWGSTCPELRCLPLAPSHSALLHLLPAWPTPLLLHALPPWLRAIRADLCNFCIPSLLPGILPWACTTSCSVAPWKSFGPRRQLDEHTVCWGQVSCPF